MKRFLMLIVFLAMGIALPIVMFNAYKNNQRLMDEGIDVEAKIVSAKKNGVRATSGSTVTVEYTNKDGEIVTAKGIINDGDYTIGREFKGKYLPDDPKTVHLPAKKSLMYLVNGMMGALTLLSWGVIISSIYNKATGSSVGKNGIIARAQVLNYNVENNMCTVTFRRADGIDCTVDVYSDIPYGTGSYINIKYIPKGKSAKVILLGY